MGIYDIKVRAAFNAAHNLRRYRGKCERLHGHNWLVFAVFRYERLKGSGMAIDFKEARKVLRGVLERLDHTYLNEIACFKKVNPTSENIAKLVFDRIRVKNRYIRSVEVWETEGSSAAYSED
jgi:6-pyruvoyltetrahydropterin/6-carboxytetrahydropterin synthase